MIHLNYWTLYHFQKENVCIYRAESTENHLSIFLRAFLGHTSAQIQFTTGVWKPGYQSKVKHYEYNRATTFKRDTYSSLSLWTIPFAPVLLLTFRSASSFWTLNITQISLALFNAHKARCQLRVCPLGPFDLAALLPFHGLQHLQCKDGKGREKLCRIPILSQSTWAK